MTREDTTAAAGCLPDIPPAEVLDVDLLIGRYPDRPGPPGDPDSVRAVLDAHGIGGGLVCSLRGPLFDVDAGNAETRRAALPGFHPVSTVDLRDGLRAVRTLDRLADQGRRIVRLFCDEQHIEPDFPALRQVARRAADQDFLVLVSGDVRRLWRPFAGIGARVIFLDTHFYHLGDFLLLARDEPGFHTSSRLLSSPDGLELVAAEVGAERMLLGTRTPLYEAAVPLLRLAKSGLDGAQRRLVAGANLRRLLEGRT
ncbi:hypothetical protein [Amycolatopsis taiwanensis]|uniref:Amidohydrolase-related domain-containing protein n=1 Tax=Amycolatopsis taiwanensis TaxID=342230 RepID=A0A9W6VK88_9PSEU|nr:hypothetical protein [Amycolatopsis taiwanensis]GLY70344.1 hypothetical protein Atai01_69630 [Amycolatopsis taiwanensis]